jgi:hypothetical protein
MNTPSRLRMRSAAGDDPDSGGTSTPASLNGEARLLAGVKTGRTEAAQSVGDSQGKRRKVEGVSVGKSRAAEGGKRMLTAEEVALAARPLPPEEIPYPKSGEHTDVVAWINANDALYNEDNLGEEGDNLISCSICYQLRFPALPVSCRH